jgi:hypothetical protein
MAEPGDVTDWTSSTRGGAAWKEATERVASRNSEARKQGKQQREALEKDRRDTRRAAEAKQHAQLLKRRSP